jgi:hypothetical protein
MVVSVPLIRLHLPYRHLRHWQADFEAR